MFHRPPAAICAAAILCASLPLTTRAADDVVPVPRSEWEALKREMAEMRREIRQMKAERPSAVAVPAQQPGNVANTAPASEQKGLRAPLASLSKSLTEMISPGTPGTNRILISGEAQGAWLYTDEGSRSGFDAFFSPIFRWEMNDRLSFDAKINFTLDQRLNFFTGEGADDVFLDYAHLDWRVSDQFTLVLGKFRSPMNIFAERYHYAYINPLPDAPLGLLNEVLPTHNVGVQLRGEFNLPYDGGHITTTAYAGNAPSYTGPFPGNVDFPDDNFGDDNYAFGGRLGWQVCRNLEVGYGVQFAKAQPEFSGGPTIPFLAQSVDLQTWFDALRGRWRLQAQYGWSGLDQDDLKYRYDLGTESYAFSRHRHGGYVQLSYRAKDWESDFLNHLEFIVRGDRLYYSGFQQRQIDFDNFTNEPFIRETDFPNQEVNRLTLGIDYWITDYTALKAAYEYSNRDVVSSEHTSRIILGFATGL